MTDQYDGDIKIIIGGDGADYQVTGGQPLMTTGLENHVDLSLMTEPGWYGFDLEIDANRRIASKWISAVQKPITRQSLLDTSKAANSDLTPGDYFGKITPRTTNPESQQVLTELLLEPPSGDPLVLRLSGQGQNWLSQISDPASEKVI